MQWLTNKSKETIPSLLSGINGLASSFNIGANAISSSAQEDTINALSQYTNSQYSDYDALQNAMNTIQYANTNLTGNDLYNLSNGQQVGSIASGVLAGAGAGMGLSPIGALIGGALGGISSGLGIMIGDNKARKRADKLNQAAEIANTNASKNFAFNAQNINNNRMYNNLINMAALGGKLDSYSMFDAARAISKSAIKYPHSRYAGNFFAYGGNMKLSGDWSNGVTIVKNGGTHEQNPFGGVMVGIDDRGVPNLVEENEVIFNDYVFSNRLKPSKSQLNNILLNPKYKGKTFAEIAKDIQKESAERPNDPISKTGLADNMMKLEMIQEETRMKKNAKNTNTYPWGGQLTPDELDAFINYQADKNVADVEASLLGIPSVSQTNNGTSTSWETGNNWLRYAPVVGSGISTLLDTIGVTNKPDYNHESLLTNAEKNFKSSSYRPLGDYINLTPADSTYELNKLYNQGLGTQRDILNSTSGNRNAAIASLLALNNNVTSQVGDVLRKAQTYNNNLKLQNANFNRGTNQYNSQLGLQTDMANAELNELLLNSAAQKLQYRDSIDSATSQARSLQSTNFLQNLGGVGNENMAWAWRKMLLDKGYYPTFK